MSHHDQEETIHREYDDHTRIVEFTPEGFPDERRYRFEATMYEGKEFELKEFAELYADVYFAVDSFREEKTGRRGVPPAVAAAGKPELAAYILSAHRGVHTNEWLEHFFDVERETIQTYLSRVRRKAEETRDRLEEKD
jgi:hypothetical protein